MSTCKQKLIADGAARVPRTCQKCHFGPCQEQSSSNRIDATGPIKQIAGLVQKLSYRDMQSLSNKIAVAIKQEHGTVKSEHLTEALLKFADEILV